MAEFLTLAETKNYLVSTGKTVDLVELIGTSNGTENTVPAAGTRLVPGMTAWVSAMGRTRRGVIVKVTPTKAHVALTTQTALDAPLRGRVGIRVQTVAADHNYVYIDRELAETEKARRAESLAAVKAVAAPVEREQHADRTQEIDAALPLDTSSELAQSLIAADHEEAIRTEVQREISGSAVVKLLERMYERIRSEHPELPPVVIVTGAGLAGDNKWGHFRANGWHSKDAEHALHEMFMAGETLAKGARQALQTMLHESAHLLAHIRGVKDTSRQGRWHNASFRKMAAELGLEYKREKADRSIGFSAVTLTEKTIEHYADLLTELEAEITLSVKLPGWLGGSAGEDGGEKIGTAPAGGETARDNGKLVCLCEEPNIIRASKKVAEKLVVRCDDCESLFRAA